MVWRPGATHDYFDAGQMTGGHLVTILVLLDFFVVDQVRDVNQHAPGINFAAGNVLIKRGENLVDLDGEGTRFGLALALPDRLFPKLAQILTANGGGKFEVKEFPRDRKVIDIGDFHTDDRAFRAATGWSPRVALTEGLRRTLDFYRLNLPQYL